MARSTFAVGVLAIVSLAGSALAVDPHQPEIRREGVGERRESLNKMELKAFPVDAFASLTEWTNGAAPTADSIKGKVVIVATWAAWVPASQQLITRLNTLAEKHQDLVVIAVHDGRRFEAAAAYMNERGIKLLSARDAEGKFRKAIHSDADPDLYLIDRAGNMRFADFESDVLDRAVTLAINESAEAAAKVPADVADAEKARREAAGRTTSINGIAGRTKVKVTYPPPSAEQYETVIWPKKNEAQGMSSLASDIQGQKWPVDFSKGEWLNEKPELLGKIVLVDYWGTWCDPCIRAKPLLEDMAEKLRDDLVVIGVTGYGSDEKNKLQVQQFLRHHPDSRIHQIFDSAGELAKPMQVRGFPCVFLITTDGTVRWQGHPGQPEFRRLAEALIKVDPGVQARRAAEQKAAATMRGSVSPGN